MANPGTQHLSKTLSMVSLVLDVLSRVCMCVSVCVCVSLQFSGSQLGAILPSRAHLAMSGDIFGGHYWREGAATG